MGNSNRVKLSPHFYSDEFNDPSTGTANVDMRLVRALEELRSLIGRPIKILSGYRSPAHNAKVGGAQSSKHCTGEAADIQVNGMDLLDLLTAVGQVSAFKASGFGLYPEENFIHVDVNRDKPARWARVGGKYVSLAAGIKAYSDKVAAKKAKGVPTV
jgi:uncharacterized protein YcbK (DUF882 family)